MEELTCSEIFLLNFLPETPSLLVATSGVNNCVAEGQGFLGIVQESSSSQVEDDRGWEARGREGAGPEKKPAGLFLAEPTFGCISFSR